MSRKTIVIGAGVAAAAVARTLLDRAPGDTVEVFEAGPQVAAKERRAWWDFVIADRASYEHCHDLPLPAAGRAVGENETVGPVPWQFDGSRLMGYGGSTFHWGGWALRFKPEDFHVFSNTGRGADWPFQYDDLKDHYLAAERLLSVSGEDPHDWTPRDGHPYPLPAFPPTAADGPMMAAFDALDIKHAAMPVARLRHCMTTGTCKYCPLGARFAASQMLDALAAAHPGRFRVAVRTPVTELVVDRKSRVVAARCMDGATGKTFLADADQFVVCSGSYESPKLLLRSVGKWWNHGIGNDFGHVGRYLISHPFLYVRGMMASNPQRLQQELDFPTLMSRQFDSKEHQKDGKLFLFRDRSKPRVNLAKMMTAGKTRAEIDAAVRGPIEWELQGFMEEFANPANAVSLAGGLNRFGLPQTRVDYRRHGGFDAAAARHLERMKAVLLKMGLTLGEAGVQPQRGDHAASTCRMARSRDDGVVDENLRVFDLDNLYVCSNAVFPSGAAVNPTLTVTALAVRLGHYLGGRP